MPRQENGHLNPWFLPDGRYFLYSAAGADLQQAVVYAGDVASKDPVKNRRKVLAGCARIAYSQGYVLFLRDRTLMAKRFDTGGLETRGDAAQVAEQVDALVGVIGIFGVSQNGVLVYTLGAGGNTQRLWYDRSGKPGGAAGTPGLGLTATISQDGSTVAFDHLDQNGGADVWLLDLERGNGSRFTFPPGFNIYPVWSPDGSRVAYYSFREGSGNIYVKTRGGAGQEQALDKAPGDHYPLDWSRDGQYIVERTTDPKTKQDIWVLPLFGDQKPFVYLNTEFNEMAAKLSPNGLWLAYVSDETNRNEVYLQTFPKPGGKIQISTSGGDLPVWSRDGKELYYIAADRKLMAVEIRTSGDTIQPGAAKALFPVRLDSVPGGSFAYDVSEDGRFLIPTPVEQPATVPFTVVVNWTAGLKK